MPDDTARLRDDADRCDICCCPKARHIGSDLQCSETAYFRSMAEHQRLLDRIEALEAGLRKIADAPAWGAPDRWEATPAEVRQFAQRLLASGPGCGQKLRPIEEAPKTAAWIAGWFKVGFTIRPIPIHWASDLSGGEQPPFQGWFRDGGRAGFVEADMDNFIGWEPLNEKAARALVEGERG